MDKPVDRFPSRQAPIVKDEPLDTAWDDMVLVGIVARTHGLRGHVVLNALTDFV